MCYVLERFCEFQNPVNGTVFFCRFRYTTTQPISRFSHFLRVSIICEAVATDEHTHLQNRQVSSPLILLQPDSIRIANIIKKDSCISAKGFYVKYSGSSVSIPLFSLVRAFIAR